jgi:siderophore synthetase component
LPQHPPARSPAERGHDAWLRANRPDLAGRFAAELPAARAAVLSRLWGAIAREPLPDRVGSASVHRELAVRFRHATVCGPADAATPFAVTGPGLTVGGERHPATLAAHLWPDRPAFAAELDNSVANLALARAANARTTTGTGLADAEQSIVDGHPLHPCCRTRTGMTTADVLAYAPEHRRTVDLPVIAVPPGNWVSTGTGLPPRLVMHPWQWARVRAEHPDLVDTGERRYARPLMSLRTLATADAHVKTALTAGMTSATRTVSAAAIHNGPLLSTLLRDLRTAGLDVLAEPAGGAVLVDGEPSRHLAMVLRERPRLGPGQRALPVAALTAGRPRAEDLIGTGDPVAFLAGFAGVLLPPLLTLLDLGIALEAHGQNLVLVTVDGRPHRLLYRDFGGVRVSPAMLAHRGIAAPPLRGDIACDDPAELTAKVLASAVATVLAQVVDHLARRYGVEPARLWAAVVPHCPAWLRDRDDLPLKAMTAMRLAGTVDDVWTAVPNPLAGRS